MADRRQPVREEIIGNARLILGDCRDVRRGDLFVTAARPMAGKKTRDDLFARVNADA